MHAGLRFLRSAAAAVALGLAAHAAAQTQLSANSPFLPAGSLPALAAAPLGGLEFVAVLTEGKKTNVDLYDPLTKKSRWIPVRGEVDGIAVLAYDATRNQVSIRSGGVERRLTLRKDRGVIPGAAPVANPAISLAASTAGPTPASMPGVKPAPSPTPPVIAKEQEEARMLVSDLLDIGLAQRKAHEETQKKAAGQAQPAKPAGG